MRVRSTWIFCGTLGVLALLQGLSDRGLNPLDSIGAKLRQTARQENGGRAPTDWPSRSGAVTPTPTESLVTPTQTGSLVAPDAGGAGATAAAMSVEPEVASCEINQPLVPSMPPVARYDVLDLKERLFQLGFFYGTLHDRYDGEAQQAVLAFQRARQLPATGIVDLATWEALAAGVEVPAAPAAAPLPASDAERWILIDAGASKLTLFVDGKPYKSWPVATGRIHEGKYTPVGEWRIINKDRGWGGGFGTRWLGLNVPWGIYGVHGTNKPWSIGRRASAGCIRMFNQHVEELFELVETGTLVKIVGPVPPDLHLRKEMKPGASGKDVVQVQLRLKSWGVYNSLADGRYGDVSAQAVEHLQAVYDLPVDGKVWFDVYALLGLKKP